MDEQIVYLVNLSKRDSGEVNAQIVKIDTDKMSFRSIDDTRSTELYLLLTEGERHED